MSDSLTKKGKPDIKKINITQEWERKYWSVRFLVSERELRRAVEKVGPMVEDVRKYLKEKKRG